MGKGGCRLSGFGAYIWDGMGGWELLSCWWLCTNIYRCFRCGSTGLDFENHAVVGMSFRFNNPHGGAMQLY